MFNLSRFELAQLCQLRRGPLGEWSQAEANFFASTACFPEFRRANTDDDASAQRHAVHRNRSAGRWAGRFGDFCVLTQLILFGFQFFINFWFLRFFFCQLRCLKMILGEVNSSTNGCRCQDSCNDRCISPLGVLFLEGFQMSHSACVFRSDGHGACGRGFEECTCCRLLRCWLLRCWLRRRLLRNLWLCRRLLQRWRVVRHPASGHADRRRIRLRGRSRGGFRGKFQFDFVFLRLRSSRSREDEHVTAFRAAGLLANFAAITNFQALRTFRTLNNKFAHEKTPV